MMELHLNIYSLPEYLTYCKCTWNALIVDDEVVTVPTLVG